jgi:hypothetical protein
MTTFSTTRWFCNFKEHGKRVVAAFLAVTTLASACPVQTYAAQLLQEPTPATLHDDEPDNTPVQISQEIVNTDSIAASTVRPVLHREHFNREPIIDTDDDNTPNTIDIETDTLRLTAGEQMAIDSIAALTLTTNQKPDEWVPREVEFAPDPTRAVWYAALFPGLGQIYNRRYWKLPLVVGGYLGLAYATSWNNSMLRDYTKAYADLLDNDPSTNSYMDLFSPNVKEESIDKTWLQSVVQSRKNYFRRNRDLCIICMIGVYFLAMIDAYVDASLSHFDISPDLSMDVAPALMQDGRQRYPSIGLVWAVNF